MNSHTQVALYTPKTDSFINFWVSEEPYGSPKRCAWRKKKYQSLKGKFSELLVSWKKCLNYIHFLTSKDSRESIERPNSHNKYICQSTHFSTWLLVKKKKQPTKKNHKKTPTNKTTKNPTNQKSPQANIGWP